MNYRQLDQTKIQVSAICMGCWGIVGDMMWGDQDEKESIATIHTALDSGINFFETAEGYGDGYSETILGKAFKNHRSQAIIATKVSRNHLNREDLLHACERSLKRLNSDYIDLYQIHWPDPQVPFEETMGTLQDLQAQGKIRAIGVSNFGMQDLAGILNAGKIVSNQLPYSLLFRAIEFQILQECIDQHISVLCYSPLLHGLLTGRYSSPDEFLPGRARTRHFSSSRPLVRHNEPGCEVETFEAIQSIRQIANELDLSMTQLALSWLLQQPGVTSVIAGARSPAHIQGIVSSVDINLSTDVMLRLADITEPVKQLLGQNPDMWQSESRFH
jgi:myo-inositol catabolism protein IolS